MNCFIFWGSYITDTNYLYTGEQFDGDLDQYYLRARYYDQNVGRFTQQDEWMGRDGEPVTLSKYLYTHADPVNGVDPSGYKTLTGQMIATSIQSSWHSSAQLGFRVFLRKSGKKIVCLSVTPIFEQALIDAMTNGIYILKDSNGSYTGQTNDYDRRLKEHKRVATRNIERLVAKFEFLSSDRNERRLVEQFIMNLSDMFDEIPDRIKQNSAISKKGGSKNTRKLREQITDLDFCKD